MTNKFLLLNAHRTLVIAITLGTIAAIAAYGYEEQLSLGTQIFAHITLILIPAIIKIAYIVRLIALNNMGLPVN